MRTIVLVVKAVSLLLYFVTTYTFGPPLRIPDIKNVGKDLAPEELRISHDCPMGHGRPEKILDFQVQKSQNP